MNFTEHFSIEEWADYARGLVDVHYQAAMSTHLETGCRSCTEVHDSFALVSELALRDACFEPPPATLRLAKSLFNIPRPTATLARLSQAAVELLFDSRSTPAPAGVRSAATEPRRLVFKSGDLLVDVQLSSADARQKVLIGQVASQRGSQQVDGMHVLLHTPRESIARAAVNRLGEFHMEFEPPGEDLSLAFVLYNGVTVIPLGMLS